MTFNHKMSFQFFNISHNVFDIDKIFEHNILFTLVKHYYYQINFYYQSHLFMKFLY